MGMKVVVCDTPGTLRLEERPRPEPGAGEVVLRVRRMGVCGTDLHIFQGKHPYLQYPRVMGHELSGEIAAAGRGARLAEGTPV
jgi:threonine dehydrogenase-like Zn-dependent dehydrogenase